ncbi:hypothetical protein PR048_025963 [Dryococelus australis]|uniref:Uncharacterized protein n=1 Tax=Dryococelus australis TaxID=614101 RepID=A0ABQ9GK20_9NEOP|nr:hypothetical protein PR048_025963 [Dryococelus australis]
MVSILEESNVGGTTSYAEFLLLDTCVQEVKFLSSLCLVRAGMWNYTIVLLNLEGGRDYLRDSNVYTVADCSDLLCVTEPPSKQYITTPNSKTIHGKAIEGRRIFYGNHLFTEIRRLCNHNKIFECDFSHTKLIEEHRK